MAGEDEQKDREVSMEGSESDDANEGNASEERDDRDLEKRRSPRGV